MTSYESTTSRFQPQTPSQCVLIEDLLPLYVEGEVSPGTRDVIVTHLAQCEHCAGFLAGAQSVRAQLRQERQERSRVVAHDGPALGIVRTFQFIAATAAVLAFGMVGFLLYGFLWPVDQLSDVLGLLVPFGACVAGSYALVMLLTQRRGRRPFERWLHFGTLVALCGVGLLMLIARVDAVQSVAESLLRYTLFYHIIRLAGDFGPLFLFGIMSIALALLIALAYMLLQRREQTGNQD